MGLFGKKNKEEPEEEEETETGSFKGKECNFQYKDSDGDITCNLSPCENGAPICEGKNKCPFWKEK